MTLGGSARSVDLAFDNDDSSLIITSGPVRDLGDDRQRWHRAVRRGLLLPIALPSSCYTVARVVVGPVAPALRAAIVATARFHLELLDERLVLTGSRGLVAAAAAAARTFTLALSAGHYRVDVHVLLGSPGGVELCEEAGRDLGAWWDRTRPREARPRWVDGEFDARAKLLDLVIHVSKLRGRRPPRPTMTAEGGDYLSLDRFVRRWPRRCPDAVTAAPTKRRVEVRDDRARVVATAALARALDTPTAAELRAEAALAAQRARLREAYQRALTARRAEAAVRATEVAEQKRAATQRRRLGAVRRKPLWMCDLGVENVCAEARLAASDAAAAALGLSPLADLMIELDFPMGFRVYAAPRGDAYALFLGDQSLSAFEVISRYRDGRILVTAYDGIFSRVPPSISIEPQVGVRSDAVHELWRRHHARRGGFAGPAVPLPVATEVGRIVKELQPLLAVHV